jgi:predicted metal-binding protein
MYNWWTTQEEEISKCLLVCKNCHHELHDLMKNSINKYNELIINLEIKKQNMIKLYKESKI